MATDVHAIIRGALADRRVASDVFAWADDVLTALAAHGVEIIADLPSARRIGPTEATVQRDDGEVFRYNAHPDPGQAGAAARRMAADWLAVARALEAEPDPADVAALATLVGNRWTSHGEDIARDLLRAGVRLPEGA